MQRSSGKNELDTLGESDGSVTGALEQQENERSRGLACSRCLDHSLDSGDRKEGGDFTI